MAVSHDSLEDIQGSVEKHGFEFPWLSDAETNVISKFQLLHENAVPGRDLARPAVVFVRADGTISGSIQVENYRHSVTPEALMEGFEQARGTPVTSP